MLHLVVRYYNARDVFVCYSGALRKLFCVLTLIWHKWNVLCMTFALSFFTGTVERHYRLCSGRKARRDRIKITIDVRSCWVRVAPWTETLHITVPMSLTIDRRLRSFNPFHRRQCTYFPQLNKYLDDAIK